MRAYTKLLSIPACFLIFIICATPACRQAGAQQGPSASREEEALFVAKKAFEDGFYEVSLGLLERFLKNYPASSRASEANLLIGECYFHQNRFLDALNKFEAILKQPQLSREIKDAVLYWIAEVHFKGSNFLKAGEYYRMVIDEFPKSFYAVYANYSLGWCLFQESDFKEAMKYFIAVEEKFPKEPQAPDASLKVIECLYNLKDYSGLKERAKVYLKSLARYKEKIPYLYFYMAEADYYLNNLKEAVDEYTKAVSSSGDNKMKALSGLGLGWSFLKLKQYQEARDAFMGLRQDFLEKKSQDILLLGKAVLAFETKDFGEAQKNYTALSGATQDPVILIQAYLGKADVFYNTAKYKEALAAYKEALGKITPGVIPQEIIDKVHYGLAWSFLKEGEFKEAIDEFSKIVSQTEDKTVKVAALCQIGDTYQDSGDYAKAQEAYDRILKDYPDSFYGDYVQYQSGLNLLKANNYDGAVMSFLTFKNNFPASKLIDEAVYALGLAYFQKEDYNASSEIFGRFEGEFKDSSLKPQALYLLGTSLYNLGKFSESVEVFKNVIRLYGQDAELAQKAEYEIADCFYQMGNEKEAMNRFKVLRSKYPDSRLTPEVMWWLGEYYYRHNDLPLARRYFSSLIQDFSKSSLVWDAYYAMGSISAEESKYDEAIDNFRKVLAAGKSDLSAQAAVSIADIYLKQEKLDPALNAYQDIVKSHPNLMNLVYLKMGDIYQRMGNLPQALDLYRKSLEIIPARQMAGVRFKVAEILEAQGKTEEAVEEYLKVGYLFPQEAGLAVRALLRVAAIYETKEDLAEALNIYAKVAALNVEEAKYAREKIEWINRHTKEAATLQDNTRRSTQR